MNSSSKSKINETSGEGPYVREDFLNYMSKAFGKEERTRVLDL